MSGFAVENFQNLLSLESSVSVSPAAMFYTLYLGNTRENAEIQLLYKGGLTKLPL